jgi:hypothetical protein
VIVNAIVIAIVTGMIVIWHVLACVAYMRSKVQLPAASCTGYQVNALSQKTSQNAPSCGPGLYAHC